MRTTVMEGSLSDFDLASVLQVVSLGRQYTSIELFDEGGNVVGTLLLKSGKILGATTGTASGIAAVSSLIHAAHHKRFSVYRTEPADDVQSPVGSVGEVLMRLFADKLEGGRIPVMQGTFADFDLASVLQVLGLSRQLTTIEISDGIGKILGRIDVKAGKVLAAVSGQVHGLDAVRKLALGARNTSFAVFRSFGPVPEGPLGDLARILVHLEEPDDDWGAEPMTHAASVAEGAPAVPVPQAPAPPPTQPKLESADDVAPRGAQAPFVEARAPQVTFVEAATSSHGLFTVPSASQHVPVLALTGPKGGAGKTTIAINLGVAFARQGKRTVIVDTDANGVLLALNAADKGAHGAYDVIAGKARVRDVAIKTRIPNLRIVPAGDTSREEPAPTEGWRRLFRELRAETDIVLVDTGAGVQSPSLVHAACSHALIVMPAEPTAIRALPAHLKRLQALGAAAPAVLGIVLNMLDYRARVSIETLRDLCGGPSAHWVFDIPIARSTAFMEAVARGVPVCRSDRVDTPTIGWVFEMLASGILERLGILTPAFDEALLS